MRENRTYGSAGGEAYAFPTPINPGCVSKPGIRHATLDAPPTLL